ncbi:MAG: DinB family protein [Chitinophagales bacterium]|nr:DinB family protein [Chitinophagales bacterium]
MSMIEFFLQKLREEAETTRKMLQRVPDDKYDWQPHPKSMTMIRLATHVAELPSWVTMTLNTSELDFAANPYTPEPIANNAELLSYFEKNQAEAEAQLSKAIDAQMEEMWTLRDGDQVYSTRSKADVICMSISQTIHHRAQLGVYLRLLDIPIPGSYGPSADESNFG